MNRHVSNQYGRDEDGKTKSQWEGGEIVTAVAFDVPG